ncbi:MAG: DUF3375 domain-containing protein, partial [Hymenobacteraceae bacterium]|nr:DUF3375 domain-containing protein [Hymenobacteraceae bacterium]
MNPTLTSIVKTRSLIESSATFKLLRARNLPLIITFLYREFKEEEQISIPRPVLVQRLEQYLEEQGYTDEEDTEETEFITHDLETKARSLIEKWSELHFLRIVVDDATKEALVILSKHTEKVFQIFDLLKNKEFVSTDSKFRDLFAKLREIIEQSNPDQEQRLAELEKKKQAIEAEIRQIKLNGYVNTFEDYQVKGRYEEITRLANELVGDFKEVEDNFANITRRIYENQQKAGQTKGKLIADTFDAVYELRSTDQGKSFYAFWQFMLDDTSQAEFQQLTRQVYQVLEDRGIAVPSRSLRKLKALLHSAARKVLDKNG